MTVTRAARRQRLYVATGTKGRKRRWGTPAGAASRARRPAPRGGRGGDDAGRRRPRGRRPAGRRPDDVDLLRSIGGSETGRISTPSRWSSSTSTSTADPQRMRPDALPRDGRDRAGPQGAGGAGRGGVQPRLRTGWSTANSGWSEEVHPTLGPRRCRWRSRAGSGTATRYRVASRGEPMKEPIKRRTNWRRAGWVSPPRHALVALGVAAAVASGRADVPTLRIEDEFVRRVPAQGHLQAVRDSDLRSGRRARSLPHGGALMGAGGRGTLRLRFDPSALENGWSTPRHVFTGPGCRWRRAALRPPRCASSRRTRRWPGWRWRTRASSRRRTRGSSPQRDHRVGHRPAARDRAAEARRGVAEHPPAAHRHRAGPAADQGPPGRREPAGAGRPAGARRHRAARRRADPQAQLARRDHAGGGQRLERPIAGRDPRPVVHAGRGLRAGGGRRRAQGRQARHGGRRVGARGGLSRPYPARGRARQAAHPRFPGGVSRCHPGALQNRSAGDKPGQRVVATSCSTSARTPSWCRGRWVFDGEGRSVVYRKEGARLRAGRGELGASTMGRISSSPASLPATCRALRDPTRRAGAPGANPCSRPSAPPAPEGGTRRDDHHRMIPRKPSARRSTISRRTSWPRR